MARTQDYIRFPRRQQGRPRILYSPKSTSATPFVGFGRTPLRAPLTIRAKIQGLAQILFWLMPPPPPPVVTARPKKAPHILRLKIPGRFAMLYVPHSIVVRPNVPGRMHVWTYKVQSRRNR